MDDGRGHEKVGPLVCPDNQADDQLLPQIPRVADKARPTWSKDLWDSNDGFGFNSPILAHAQPSQTSSLFWISYCLD